MKSSTARASSFVCSLGLLTALACGGAEEAKKTAAPAKTAEAAKTDDAAKADPAQTDAKAEAEAKADPAPEVKPDEAAADGAAAAQGGADLPKIGVAVCDDYVAQMSKCFEGDGIPADVRAAQKEGFEQTVRGWAEMIKATPDTTQSLEVGCNAAFNMAKRSYPRCFPEAG